MNKFIEAIFGRSRLTVGLALALSLIGIGTWLTMPRQEDPSMLPRFGLIIAPYPGANAEQVESSIVDPLEDELAEIPEIETVHVTIRTGIAILNVKFRANVTDTQKVWNDVDAAIDDAVKVMPVTAIRPTVNNTLNETESVVVAISGSNDVLKLSDYADALKSRMMLHPDISRVELTGDGGEQITISMRESMVKKLNLSHQQILRALNSRNLSSPGGTLNLGNRSIELKPNSEFTSLEEIRETPIRLQSGATIPLSKIAEVRRMVAEPRGQRARLNGEVTVFVGIVPIKGLDAIRFGKMVQEEIDTFQKLNPEIKMENLAFQPKDVESRLSDLGASLLLGILIVGLLLFLTMGIRLGIVVSSIVPLVTFATIGVYGAMDGVFHQIAAAALVLALGMLVDNAIVMAELVQSNLDAGLERKDATLGAVKELFVPLLSSTATTLAAFVPMLLAPGSTGEFTRSIPVVAMIALSVSYVFAIVVTPFFAGIVLKPNKSTKPSRLDGFTKKLASFSIRRPVIALLMVGFVVGLSGSFAPKVKKNFFPQSDKKQLLVMVNMPEGTNLDATNRVSLKLEKYLGEHKSVRSVGAFVGRSTPRFYYNLPLKPNASHLAQLVVKVEDARDIDGIMADLSAFAKLEVPEAHVIPKRLEQGPPVEAAVEVRLLGDDLQDLYVASQSIRKLVRTIDGTKDIRANHGPGKVYVEYDIDDAQASRVGLARSSVVSAMYGRTAGLPAGSFRRDGDLIPIRLRSDRGSYASLSQIDAIEMTSPAGRIPISRITSARLQIGPAVIHRYRGMRKVSVFSDVESHTTYEEIVSELVPKLENFPLPEGVEWEIGGATEASVEANEGISKNGPLALILLLAILLAQFNSFRKTLIVLLTAPMAILGIWPGLYLGGLTFGFIALLGAIALLGVVVNGAIVLLDVIDLERDSGATIAASIESAIMRRTRPILLTTLTTIAGLMPLLFSNSSLWPPMAAAMISGLTIATVLTLVAVPASYRLLFRNEKSTSAVSDEL